MKPAPSFWSIVMNVTSPVVLIRDHHHSITDAVYALLEHYHLSDAYHQLSLTKVGDAWRLKVVTNDMTYHYTLKYRAVTPDDATRGGGRAFIVEHP